MIHRRRLPYNRLLYLQRLNIFQIFTFVTLAKFNQKIFLRQRHKNSRTLFGFLILEIFDKFFNLYNLKSPLFSPSVLLSIGFADFGSSPFHLFSSGFWFYPTSYLRPKSSPYKTLTLCKLLISCKKINSFFSKVVFTR